MALIICKQCGKKCSDTVDKCIHCGAATKDFSDLPPVPVVEEVIKKNLPRYEKMPVEQQIMLEMEFLNSDPAALKYRRSGLEIKKFGFIASWLFFAGQILLLVQQYVLNTFFNGIVYNEKMFEISYYFLAGIVILWIVSFVWVIYLAISYRNKIRRLTYLKKFKNFLLEEKEIDFSPNILTNKEKDIFEQIELNTSNV